MKIGFRWYILINTVCGIEEHEPVEITFDTYAECKSNANLYSEYPNVGISLVRDDDGCIDILYQIDTPNEIYEMMEVE